MKAISIKQPWCSLIAHGIKDIENRTWPCPKKYIGQRVLIHASATSWTWQRVLSYINSVNKKLLPVFINSGYNGTWLRNLPTSSIIGSVEIVDCVLNHPSVWAEHAVYNWVLANPILFKEPIPAKGKLSFWDSGLTEEEIACLQKRGRKEVMTHIEAIFQVDHGLFLLSKINEKLSVKKAPIEKMIDNVCGYDETKELTNAARDALNMIIEGKRFLGYDYSKEVELVAGINARSQACEL